MCPGRGAPPSSCARIASPVRARESRRPPRRSPRRPPPRARRGSPRSATSSSATLPQGFVAPDEEEQPRRDQLEDACEGFLRDTDSIARDLGGWLLERTTGARPFPGGAARHDVLHLVYAPRCASAFPRGELL